MRSSNDRGMTIFLQVYFLYVASQIVSIITETLRGYSVAKINITLHIVHLTKEYENRRSESSHQ